MYNVSKYLLVTVDDLSKLTRSLPFYDHNNCEWVTQGDLTQIRATMGQLQMLGNILINVWILQWLQMAKSCYCKYRNCLHCLFFVNLVNSQT